MLVGTTWRATRTGKLTCMVLPPPPHSRDGVDEGQFAAVLREEYLAIRAVGRVARL